MSFFNQATVTINGNLIAATASGTVNFNQGGQAGVNGALKNLSVVAAHAALHDSAARFDAPRCHRNTRAKYLDKLELWMLGQGDEFKTKRLIWLNGGAGAGKSAIMQSIVERCARRHIVILGSFFFSRADPSRNYAEVLIPTLAYQLARTFPAAITILDLVINRDPLIFKASLQRQAYELLVQPILHLIDIEVIDMAIPLRKVFVIDGLDECSDPQKQALIVRVIASILSDHNIPISFLIASRPEIAISYAFESEKELHVAFATITLEADDDATSDIRHFIEDSFLDILESHPWRMYIKLPWPDPGSIDHLVGQSSGHFIYAATAMKFITSADEHPGRALKVVEGIVPSRTGSPFADLDALYTHILTRARYSKWVLVILGHCYVTQLTRSVAAICCIYNVSPEDVILFLSDVQSLISLIPDSNAELIITPKHTSLHDFLTTKGRAGALYIDWREHQESLLTRYFQLVDNGPRTPTSSFSFRRSDARQLIQALANAILGAENTISVMSLIYRHSPHDIWNFCAESCALDTTASSRSSRECTAMSVNEYMRAIRMVSVEIHDEAMYFHQFKMYIDLVLDDINDLAIRKPQYRIIPAILFSSSSSGLYWTYYLLREWGHRFRMDKSFGFLFQDVVQFEMCNIDPLTFKAIRSLPQSRVSWGSDLATALGLVLRQLVNLSRPSCIPYTTPHRKWLLRHKPLKQMVLGSPRLSSAFFSSFSAWICPDERTGIPPYLGSIWTRSAEFMMKRWHARKINTRKMKCLTLLQAVIFYSRKSDCIIEVVKLARRSLPMAALWYPELMARALAEMDAYVWRWEGTGVSTGITPPVTRTRSRRTVDHLQFPQIVRARIGDGFGETLVVQLNLS